LEQSFDSHAGAMRQCGSEQMYENLLRGASCEHRGVDEKNTELCWYTVA